MSITVYITHQSFTHTEHFLHTIGENGHKSVELTGEELVFPALFVWPERGTWNPLFKPPKDHSLFESTSMIYLL